MALTAIADSGVEKALEAFTGTGVGIVSAQRGERKPAHKDSLVIVTGSSARNLSDKIQLNGFESVQLFALLPSTRTSHWLLPLGNTRCALSGSRIYAPYAWRARVLKKLLLAAIRISSSGWSRHKVLIASTKPLGLQRLVTDLTGEQKPVFSLLLGTPGPFRKLTIQVMRPTGEILGYIKVALTEPAIARVCQEAAMLQRLSTFPVLRPYIPRIIYSSEWQGRYLLFQSSGPIRVGPVEFGPRHQQFLQTLWSVHQVEKPGRLFVEEITSRWQKIDSLLDPMLRELGERALERVRRNLCGTTIRCGIMHGDFAPWNTRLGDQKELFVFDWESAVWEAPISWDVCHFHAQIASLLKKNWNGSSYVPRQTPSEKASLLLYLLNSIFQSFEGGSRKPVGMECRVKILQQELR